VLVPAEVESMTDRRLPEVSELRGILPDRLVIDIASQKQTTFRNYNPDDPIGLSESMLNELEHKYGDTRIQSPAVICRHFLLSLIKANRELNRLWEQG
jgi:hypothetical protein